MNWDDPRHYPYLSVATPSVHDTSTLRGWWEEDRNQTQQFFNQQLGQTGPAPQFCETWVVDLILKQHLQSPSMIVIIPIQDLLATQSELRILNPDEERINV